MLNRSIPLKRNIILIQLLIILPLVFLSGIIACLIHYIKLENWDKIFLSVMFVFQIALAFRIYSYNTKYIKFTNNEIAEYKKGKEESKILNTYQIDAIKSIICNDKKKEIKFLYHNCQEKYFLKFKYTNLIGEEVYFKVKSELCRYYPTKTVSIRDEYIEKYLETDILPEYIKSKAFAERCGAIILIFFEFIFAVIPIGLTILSVVWALLSIWVIFLQIFVWVVNLLT